MEWQEEEYKRSVWEIYRGQWATASPEKRIELNERMRRWQELMKNGLTASQSYRMMQEEFDKRIKEPAQVEPSKMKICGICGASVDDTAKKCPECGKDICVNCGNPLGANVTKCPKCGQEVLSFVNITRKLGSVLLWSALAVFFIGLLIISNC